MTTSWKRDIAGLGSSRAWVRKEGRGSRRTREKEASLVGGCQDTSRPTSWLETWDGQDERWGLLASKFWTAKCGDLQGSKIQIECEDAQMPWRRKNRRSCLEKVPSLEVADLLGHLPVAGNSSCLWLLGGQVYL